MKKYFILFLIFLISSGFAFTANWMPVTDKWDIDLDSIEWQQQDSVRGLFAWLRNDVTDENWIINGEKSKYIFYYELFGLDLKYIFTLREAAYNEKGKQLNNIAYPYGQEPRQIPPNSTYDYISDILRDLTPAQLKDYKAINLMRPNAIPFGTVITRPDEDMKKYYPLKHPKEFLISDEKHKYKEADYVNTYCNGQIEYILPNSRTRVDCLTDEYAIEFDFASKWKEAIGQALYYAKITNRKPAVAIIMKQPTDENYINRIIEVDKNITIFRIRAFR